MPCGCGGRQCTCLIIMLLTWSEVDFLLRSHFTLQGRISCRGSKWIRTSVGSTIMLRLGKGPAPAQATNMDLQSSTTSAMTAATSGQLDPHHQSPLGQEAQWTKTNHL